MIPHDPTMPVLFPLLLFIICFFLFSIFIYSHHVVRRVCAGGRGDLPSSRLCGRRSCSRPLRLWHFGPVGAISLSPLVPRIAWTKPTHDGFACRLAFFLSRTFNSLLTGLGRKPLFAYLCSGTLISSDNVGNAQLSPDGCAVMTH